MLGIVIGMALRSFVFCPYMFGYPLVHITYLAWTIEGMYFAIVNGEN